MKLAQETSRPATVCAALLIAALPPALFSCSGDGGGEDPPTFEPLVWEGPHALIRANCASCHGANLTGGFSWVDPQWPAPDLTGYPAAYVKSVVREGRPHVMPAMPPQEISDDELEVLGAYVEGLPGTAVPDPPYDVTVTITDEDPWFNSPEIVIPQGTTVRFVNGGRTYHPVVELDYLAMGGQHGTTSRNLGPGGAWFRSFETIGDYAFLCGLHPYMRCVVHVGTPLDPPVYAPNAPAPPPAVPGVGEVWVLAQFQDWPGRAKDGVLQVIDAATWTVTHQVPLGNNPHNLWFDLGNQSALVTSWFDTVVSIVDAASKTVVGTYPVGPAPAHVTSDHAGANWFVTIEGSHYVQAFTQAPGPTSVAGFVPAAPRGFITGHGPHGVWYTPGRLVTANMDATFSVIDVASMSELALLPAGLLPLGAGADSTGTLGSCGNALSATVSIYDLQNLTWVRDIPLPGGAVQVPFTPDNQKIVAANGSSVTIIDAARAANPAAYPDPASAIDATIWTGNGAHGVAFGLKAGGGWYAYVSHKFENYVSVIDLATMTKAGDVPLMTTTTGKLSMAGCTDTGGNGIAVRPNPPPWQ